MIESITFKNFKVLRDTTMPLSRFTLVIGPNGSGKSTAFQGIQAVANPNLFKYEDLLSVNPEGEKVIVSLFIKEGAVPFYLGGLWNKASCSFNGGAYERTPSYLASEANSLADLMRPHLPLNGPFIFLVDEIARPVTISYGMNLWPNGGNLTSVLDQLKGQDDDRFTQLNEELRHWLPEFDRIQLVTPKGADGKKILLLQTKEGKYSIPAHHLSEGTRVALALLTLAYLPNPPKLICLEEPDRSIHPRLLRNVKDAIYRLCYPEAFGESREPVQVIATTHSPYFLDLFTDHPEEIVIANKIGNEAKFERLSDQPYLDEVLRGSRLGEIWYTGILGGVPA